MVLCRFWECPPASADRARLAFLLLMLCLAGCRTRGGPVPTAAIPVEIQSSVPVAAPPQTLDLAECQRLALARQPRVSTQRASLAAAEDGCRALNNLRFPANLDGQVPIRRQQAMPWA